MGSIEPAQLTLDTGPIQVDLNKLVKFEPAMAHQHWLVGGTGGRRSGQIGLCLGIIGLKHSSGYEVLLQFPDGKLDTFTPMSLFPHECTN